MTKKLEELFGIPPIPETDAEIFDPIEELTPSTELISNVDINDKIDHALTTVNSLSQHDTEMNDIAEKALQSYADLCSLGMQVGDVHAARIYEVAATMLKTALEANDAKATRKMKTLDLQLKKATLDLNAKVKLNKTGEPGSVEGAEFDRNELMQYMRDGIDKQLSDAKKKDDEDDT